MAITETVEINAGPAIGELDALAAAADKAAASMERLGKGGAGGFGADKLAASMNAAADAIERAGQRAAAAMGRMSSAARSATGGVDALGASADKAGAGLDRAAAGADAAAAASDRLAAGADAGAVAMDRQAVAGKRANEGFLSKHKELLLGTAVVMGYAVDKAMKFNAQMTLLMTQAGVSSRQMPQLTKGVLELAGKVGQSPGNLAESLYHVESNMSSLGIKAPKALEMVKIAAQGASVGHANLVDVTNALTAAVASGIPGVKNYSQAMGVLNSTVGSGDMSMQDLADAMSTGVLAVIKGYGANIKDAGAALATFGDNNIRGAKAGTDLRMAVQSLAVPAKSAKNELKDLGLTTTTLADTMQKHGMLAALEQLDTAFKKHGVTARNEGQVLTDLFGKKAGVGLAVLMEQLGRLQSKYPELTAGADKFGQAWSKTLDTPQQKLRNLENGAKALAITTGNVLMPAASAIIGGLSGAMNWIQGHAFASKGLALGAGTLVAGGLAKGLFSGVEHGLSGIGKIGSLLKIPGMDKLAGLGQGAGLNGAAANLDGAAARLSAAAGELSGSAGKLDTAGTAGGAGKGGASGLAGAAGPVGLGVALGAAMRALGDKLAPAGTTAGKYSQMLQQQAGRPGPAQQLHPYIAGGFEGWLTSHIGLPVGGAINNALHFIGLGGGSAPAQHQQIANMMAGGLGKPAKLPPPDISALLGAKGKAQADAKAITTSIETALHKKVKAAPPDISAYRSAVGPAKADGQAISSGLAAGIEAGKGAAVAAANDVANAVAAAMSRALVTHSPSKRTEKIGKNAAEGLVLGLEGGKPAVDAAATALGRNVAKAADIASIDATTKKLLAEVPKGDSGLVQMLKADQGKLTQLANQRSRLEAEISDAQQIAKNAISGASIMNAPTATAYDPGSQQSAAGLIGGMQAQAGNLKLFAQQVGMLKRMGLNATSLDQIIQAGPDQGLAIAQGLTSGGRGSIAQINQLEKQIMGSAGKLGDVGGPAMYQAGVDAGKAAAAGLRSQLGAVEAAMKQLAQSMVRAARQAAHGGHGSHGGHTTVHIHVQGHVMTEHDLVSVVQEHILTRASNNWQTGVRLPGRAA